MRRVIIIVIMFLFLFTLGYGEKAGVDRWELHAAEIK